MFKYYIIKDAAKKYDGILNITVLYFPLYRTDRYNLDLGHVFATEILHCNIDNHNLCYHLVRLHFHPDSNKQDHPR